MRESEVLQWFRDVGAVGTAMFFQVNPHVGRKPIKSQVFAQRICQIALTDWGFPIKALSDSENGLEHLADEALRRYLDECDAKFRKMAIRRVLVFQRSC